MSKENPSLKRQPSARLGFVDNVRGIVVIMYMLAHYAADNPSAVEIPLWFRHGGHGAGSAFWQYFNLSLMDLGQPIFFTLIGLTVFYAFEKRLERGYSLKEAAMHAVARNCILFTASAVWTFVFVRSFDWDLLRAVAFTGLLAVPFLLIKPVRRIPSVRLALGAAILLIHHALADKLAFLAANEGGIAACIGFIGIVLIGSAIGDYSRKSPLKYTLLTAALIFIAVLTVNYWEPAEWILFNTSFMVLSLAIVNGILFILYALDKLILNGKPLPVLASLGKNMLFFFLFVIMLGGAPNVLIARPLTAFEFWAFGGIYIAVYLGLGWLFQKKNIVIKI
ncbi:MAG: hypothetical protein LBP62_02000 [Clostridiales bacterium]|jgi:hypothetical protein|nr:hypothetical protein [Clostridiales bacterium]